jgi:hypothetical protein
MLRESVVRNVLGIAAAAMLVVPGVANAQSWSFVDPIPAGTTIQVRTTEPIEAREVDGRIYTGTVENDVRDTQGRLAIPAGATAELVVRRGPDDELVLDLDSVMVNGRRYGVDATRRPVGTSGDAIRNSGIGANKDTAIHVGGGALLGAILGAAIGGGDAAAAGAVVGAAGGAATQILTRGSRVNVPSETLLTYRLQSDMNLDVQDSGYDRDGHHYHRWEPNN